MQNRYRIENNLTYWDPKDCLYLYATNADVEAVLGAPHIDDTEDGLAGVGWTFRSPLNIRVQVNLYCVDEPFLEVFCTEGEPFRAVEALGLAKCSSPYFEQDGIQHYNWPRFGPTLSVEEFEKESLAATIDTVNAKYQFAVESLTSNLKGDFVPFAHIKFTTENNVGFWALHDGEPLLVQCQSEKHWSTKRISTSDYLRREISRIHLRLFHTARRQVG